MGYPKDCNFVVVLSSWWENAGRHWKKAPDSERNWTKAFSAWKRAHQRGVSVGHEQDSLGSVLDGYLPLRKRDPKYNRTRYDPSAGMHAFFTFAPQCAYTRLYGFGGPARAS